MKVKKIANFILSNIMMISFCLSGNITAVYVEAADNFETKIIGEYGPFTYTQYDDHIVINQCDDSVVDVEIPETIYGCPVTEISNGYWYVFAENLETLTIPKTIEVIGDISGLEYSQPAICGDVLKSITVSPENPYFSSENGVLYDKEKTLLIKYPAEKNDSFFELPETVTEIENFAFNNNTNLEQVDLGNKVEKIGGDAFNGCSSLENIILPDSIIDLGGGCFHDCTSLKSVTLSQQITRIERGTFNNCVALESVFIPKNVSSIGIYEILPISGGSYLPAFMGCENLTAITVDKDNEFYTDEDGILYDKNKEKLLLFPCKKSNVSYCVPDGVQEIFGSAFRNCTNLCEISLPDSLTNISYYAFDNCTNLTSLKVPPKTYIYESAFSGCTSLTSIEVAPENPFHKSIDGVLFNAYNEELRLHTYPAGKTDKEYIVPNGVTYIKYAAFENSKLESVSLPETVTYIYDFAFLQSQNLMEITIKNPNCDFYSLFNEPYITDVSEKTIYSYKTGSVEERAKESGYQFQPLSANGDVNADGDFNIADVVTFQKWLLAEREISLNIWQAGDLCEDGRIDVFDLCLMKRMLVEQIEN